MQKTVSLSEQNIVLGYKYYLISLKAADGGQKKEYLLRALSYHSFHAFNKLAHDFFMKDMPVSEEQFMELANLLPSLEKKQNGMVHRVIYALPICFSTLLYIY